MVTNSRRRVANQQPPDAKRPCPAVSARVIKATRASSVTPVNVAAPTTDKCVQYTDGLSQSTTLPRPHASPPAPPPIEASKSDAAAVAPLPASVPEESRYLHLQYMREASRAWRNLEEQLADLNCLPISVEFFDNYIRLDYLTPIIAAQTQRDLQRHGINCIDVMPAPPPPESPANLPSRRRSAASSPSVMEPVLIVQPTLAKLAVASSNDARQGRADSRAAANSRCVCFDRCELRDDVLHETIDLASRNGARSNQKNSKPKTPAASSSSPSAKLAPKQAVQNAKTVSRSKTHEKGEKKQYLCPHGRRKGLCADCGGGSMCEHNRQKHWCKTCGGSALCVHGRQKSRCIECGGSGICVHGRHAYRCTQCKGDKGN